MNKIALLIADDFEDGDYLALAAALEEAGHSLETVGSHAGAVVEGLAGGVTVTIDATVAARSPSDYGALVIPDGHAAERLRADPAAVDLVRGFFWSDRPILSLGRGAQMLVEADVLRGVRATSLDALKTDLVNAGARWCEDDVVTSGSLITTRRPEHALAAVQLMLEQLGENIKATSFRPGSASAQA